jgi:polysaccharide export outer membrane protein
VTLVVSQYRSQKISAIGEFNHPGMILLDQPTDLFSVIAQAGGVATTGGDTVVLIHGATRTSYSINQLMAQDDAQNRSIMVGGGDVIFIPRSLVFVNGEVNHPGGFRLEAGMTVLQAISEAGGFTSKASQSSVVIHRNQTDGVHVINAKLSDPLLVGDVVDVSQSWF